MAAAALIIIAVPEPVIAMSLTSSVINGSLGDIIATIVRL